jgi:O-antigen/teichoic acid export membrane protein
MTINAPARPDADASDRRMRIARNSVLNLFGVVIPAVVALAATPVLLSELGPTAFGIFSVQLAILILLSVNDLGISRAVLLVSIAEGGFTDPERRARTVKAGIELVLLLSFVITLLSAAATSAGWFLLPVSQHEDLLSWLAIAISAAVALPSLPLRAKLETEERFGVLNLLRTTGSSLLFLAPLAALLLDSSLLATAIGHLSSRTLMLLAYIWAAGSDQLTSLGAGLRTLCARLPSMRGLPLHLELVKRGKWLGAGAVMQTMLAYVDRFALAVLVPAANLAHYSVASEIVTKIWLVVGALTVAATPQIAAGWERGDDSWRTPFRFLAASVSVIALGGHAIFSLAGMPLLKLWVGASFDPQMASLLAILSVGIAMNCAAQMNYLLLLVAGGERSAARLLLATLVITALASLAAGSFWGAEGVAWIFTVRLVIDSFMVRYLTCRQAGRTDIGVPTWGLAAMALAAFLIYFGAKV